MNTFDLWQDKLNQLTQASIGGGSTPELNSIQEFRKFICAELDALKAKIDRLEGRDDEA